MIIFEVESDGGLDGMESRIEAVCSQLHLAISLKGNLVQYPGCIHWHCRRAGTKGTLEITLWPAMQRCWISVQAGRQAAWIDSAVPAIKTALEADLCCVILQEEGHD